MKKRAYWVVLILILVAVAIWALSSALTSGGNQDFEGDTYDEEIVIVNQSFPTDVVLLGEDIYFRPAFQYRRIDKITLDSLSYDPEKYIRLVLVISDLGGSVHLIDEEYSVIKQLLDDNVIDYYYFGTSKVADLIKHGLWEVRVVTDRKEMGMGVCLYHNIQTQFNMWDEQDAAMQAINKENLGLCIVAQIARCIKSNN